MAGVLVLAGMAARGDFKSCERPFILMNKAEIEGARRRLTEPWAEEAVKPSLYLDPSGNRPAHPYHGAFEVMVRGNEAAAKAEKQKLLKFIGEDVTKSKPRSNRFDQVIRYDMLYDRLTDKERKAVEDTFRKWIHYHLHDYWRGRKSIVIKEGEPPRDTRYSRLNWLPNMLHPRGQGIFLMALALQDEALIKECFETPVAGFKWWMDHYVADGAFYMEEFNKQGSTFAELLFWCRGCKRLGLDHMGFGYVGQGDGPGHSPAATMKRYCEGWVRLGFPPEPVTEGTPTYWNVFMGDTGPCAMVRGYPVDAKVMHGRFGTAHMNGPNPKMRSPFWFEMAHAQWPDAGFDWVLSLMRLPGQDKYYPSLLFNLDPIDPEKVSPMAVASYVAPERGFGMLRMEESKDYWSSDRPAAALQFGMRYVHYVHDCFTLMHYIAMRHPVYARRAFGPWRGYAGGHPYQDSVRGHNGIVVDSLQIQPVDSGDHGSQHTRIRHVFADHVKFLGISAAGTEVKDPETAETQMANTLYPGVSVERVLCLTDEYLFDVINLISGSEHTYHWNHHPCGVPCDDGSGWQASKDLTGGKLFENMSGKIAERTKGGAYDLPNVHKREMGRDFWQLAVARGEKEPGVVIRMLGGEPTTVYRDVDDGSPSEGRRGGRASNLTTVIAERRTKNTAFVVLHEPIRGKSGTEAFDSIEQTDAGIGVRVKGDGIEDRILVAYAGRDKEPLTLAKGKESYTFRGFAHIRVAGDHVLVTGDAVSVTLPVSGRVKRLLVRGKKEDVKIEKGVLTYKAH